MIFPAVEDLGICEDCGIMGAIDGKNIILCRDGITRCKACKLAYEYDPDIYSDWLDDES